MTGDLEEAREVTQEAYLRLWERWERIQVLDDADGYLYGTAIRGRIGIGEG